MARYNEILVGRFNRALQKLLAMKGGPPSPQLASEIMPTHPFFSGAENRYLESWDRFGQHTTTGPTALNQSAVRLRNPLTSNAVAVVEKIVLCNGGGETSFVGFSAGATNVDLGTIIAAGAGQRLDPRGKPASVLVLSNDSTVVTQPTLATDRERLATLANTAYHQIWYEGQEITLLPGDGLNWVQQTVNVVMRLSLQWRERFLEDSERT